MSTNIIEFKCDLTKEQTEFVYEILSESFPLYYGTAVEKHKIFSHSFLIRNRNEDDNFGVINSGYWERVYSFFKEMCAKHGIEHRVIYRACLNVTTFDTDKMGELHDDHRFPHKVFIMYLNDFSNGALYIQDRDTKKLIEIKAEKYKVVIFDGQMHAQGFCGNGERRVALVFTFN